MKKLLVLMLVFGSASAANAALSLRIGDSEIGLTINIPQALNTIQIYSSDSTSWLGYCIVEEGGSGALSNPQVLPNAGDGAFISPYTEAGWGAGYVIQADWLSAPTQAGIQFILDLDASGLAPGSTGRISLWNDAVGYEPGMEADFTTFTVVPEPATIALLCLGGYYCVTGNKRD